MGKIIIKNKKIEILRCICILMVIYIHNASEIQSSIISNSPGWFYNMVYIISGVIGRIAVPTMFTISGYLLARNKVKPFKNIKKKTLSVLIPYLLWNTIWILIYGISIKIGILNDTGKNVLEYNIAEIIDCYTGYITGAPFVYPLWFLRDLYIMQCIIPFLRRYFSTKIWDGVVLSICITYFFGFPTEQLFMFVLGIWIYNHKNVIAVLKKIPKIIVLIIFILGTVLEIRHILFGSVFRAVSILIGMLMIYHVAAFMEYICPNRLAKIAPYTMFIYCGHQYTLLLIRHICSRILTQDILVRTVEYLCIPPLLYLGLLLCGYLMNKHLKSVYLLLSGGR